jgi:hypothetical protein
VQKYSEDERKHDNSLTVLHETAVTTSMLKSVLSRRIVIPVILQIEAPVCREDGLPHIVSQPIIPRFPLLVFWYGIHSFSL